MLALPKLFSLGNSNKNEFLFEFLSLIHNFAKWEGGCERLKLFERLQV